MGVIKQYKRVYKGVFRAKGFKGRMHFLCAPRSALWPHEFACYFLQGFFALFFVHVLRLHATAGRAPGAGRRPINKNISRRKINMASS